MPRNPAKGATRLTLVLVVLAFVALGTLAEWHSRQQQAQARARTLAAWRQQAQAQAARLDATLTGRTEAVRFMARWAGDYLAAPGQRPAQPLLGYIETHPWEDHFALERLPPEVDEAAVGNVVGAGALAARDPAVLDELNMAIALFALQRVATEIEPGIEFTYYRSRQRLDALYPRVPTAALIAAADGDGMTAVLERSQDLPVFTRALPENNPTGAPFWTVPYADAEQGPMASYAVPVYAAGRFRGAMVADYRLAWGDLLPQAGPRSRWYLVDGQDRIVASADEAEPLARFDALHSDVVLKSAAGVAPDGTPRFVRQGGRDVLVVPLEASPWRMVLLVEPPPLVVGWRSHVPAMLVGAGLVLALLLAWAQYRRAVRPAVTLAAHVLVEQEGPAPLPRVPRRWRPVFQAVSDAFEHARRVTRDHPAAAEAAPLDHEATEPAAHQEAPSDGVPPTAHIHPAAEARSAFDLSAHVAASAQSADEHALLRRTVDALPFWLAVYDAEGRLLLVNRTQAEAHGAQPEAVDADALQPDEPAAALLRQVRLTGQPQAGREPVPAHGTVPAHERRLLALPLRDEAGHLRGVIVWSETLGEGDAA